MSAERSTPRSPDFSDLQARDDMEGLRLLVQTIRDERLPDAHEVKVTAGFMLGLFEHIEDLNLMLHEGRHP